MDPREIATSPEELKTIEELIVLREMINKLLPECYFCRKPINYRSVAMWEDRDILGDDEIIFVCRDCHLREKKKLGYREFALRVKAICNFTLDGVKGPKGPRKDKEDEMDISDRDLGGADACEPGKGSDS